VSTVVLILALHCFSLFDAWCYNRTICLYMCTYIRFVFGSALTFVFEFRFGLLWFEMM